MEDVGFRKQPVLIIGDGRLACSVAVCLLQAGQQVTWHTTQGDLALAGINVHCADLQQPLYTKFGQSSLAIVDQIDNGTQYGLVIAITPEDLAAKRAVVRQLSAIVSPQTIIAINSESILLSAIQQDMTAPQRIIGANWSEPAHTTWFLELIANDQTDKILLNNLYLEAKTYWRKDPYIVSNDAGIRSKMLSAMVREAFYLVEHGYASIEDIDRACRNDPGYYLSFAGNFRYMDLMGASSYGEVMKDLNPELSKAGSIPEFFTRLLQQGHFGMETNKGLYNYQEGDAATWEQTFRKYSYQIQEIIEKYPFSGQRENE